MEVKEYIRTPYGNIEKIVRIIKESNWICIETDKSAYDLGWLNRWNAKHSKQIIDLIEPGDFVNDRKVYQVGYNFQDDFVVKFSESVYEDFIYQNEIKTILTKEQYEANCYKLEE